LYLKYAITDWFRAPNREKYYISKPILIGLLKKAFTRGTDIMLFRGQSELVLQRINEFSGSKEKTVEREKEEDALESALKKP